MTAIESIGAITLATRNMTRSVRFYLGLGFRLSYGGEAASFTSFMVRDQAHLNRRIESRVHIAAFDGSHTCLEGRTAA